MGLLVLWEARTLHFTRTESSLAQTAFSSEPVRPKEFTPIRPRQSKPGRASVPVFTLLRPQRQLQKIPRDLGSPSKMRLLCQLFCVTACALRSLCSLNLISRVRLCCGISEITGFMEVIVRKRDGPGRPYASNHASCGRWTGCCLPLVVDDYPTVDCDCLQDTS